MRLDRRGLLLASGGVTLLVAAGPGVASPLLRALPEGVGEIWGLTYWSPGAIPRPDPAPRLQTPMPSWHPEFVFRS